MPSTPNNCLIAWSKCPTETSASTSDCFRVGCHIRLFFCTQGPPGTGKTRTLLALLEAIVLTNAQHPRIKEYLEPLLACADTNTATDNLVEGLVKQNINVVRLGQPARVSVFTYGSSMITELACTLVAVCDTILLKMHYLCT